MPRELLLRKVEAVFETRVSVCVCVCLCVCMCECVLVHVHDIFFATIVWC